MTTVLPQCQNCIHLVSTSTPRCTAFPEGIPMEILVNNLDHRKPVKGDNGTRYEAANPRLPHPLAEVKRDA